jgi:hypothetical protein
MENVDVWYFRGPLLLAQIYEEAFGMDFAQIGLLTLDLQS